MEMNVYFMPHVDIEELKKDEKLHIAQDDKGYLICLQENNEASIRTYNLEQYHDQFVLLADGHFRCINFRVGNHFIKQQSSQKNQSILLRGFVHITFTELQFQHH